MLADPIKLARAVTLVRELLAILGSEEAQLPDLMPARWFAKETMIQRHQLRDARERGDLRAQSAQRLPNRNTRVHDRLAALLPRERELADLVDEVDTRIVRVRLVEQAGDQL